MNQPKMPKVTVVIPNYNHAKYLPKRIESVLNQTFQDFEVLYLDDASTDNSDEVFKRYQHDPRIRFILNQKNSGSAFKQWNKGVQEARGEYVWLAEADDYADPRLLETLVAVLEEHPNVGVAYCMSWMVDKDDNILGKLPAPPEDITPPKNDEKETFALLTNWDMEPWGESFRANGPQYYRHWMIYENRVPNASGVVFRKSVYEAAGGADATMRVCGDYMAWIQMLKIADVAFSAKPLNYFRMHLGSVRSNNNRTGLWALERYEMADYIVHDLELSPPELERLRHIRMGHWLEDVFSPTRRIQWHRTRKILKIARNMDTRFWGRLVWQSGYYLLLRTPYFNAARHWGRRLLWRSRSRASS